MTVSLQDPNIATISKDVEKPGGGSQPVLSSPRYCPGINNHAGYLCETGHCCGETGCCTYYYELWSLCGTWVWHVLHDRMYNMRCICVRKHVFCGERLEQTERARGAVRSLQDRSWCSCLSIPIPAGFLASFKLPSYEEVAARPNTPPPPYSTVFALQGGQYAQAGPSGMTSSQSSDNYTSCSCESCSASSPSSTSFSVQVTDETDTSHASTPSEAADSRPPSTDSPGAGAEPVCPGASQSPPKHALFSSNVDVFEPAGGASDAEDEDEAEADEGHYRHRRLTGDSGIEVCRCQVESEDEEEEEEEEGEQEGRGEAGAKDAASFLHDSVDCTNRTQAPQPPQ
uniref:Si:ch73-290k24.6 n=1 Tax=Lepisosteus oculatus TaxID=7918 RepID=W5M2W8_LEPOC